jgi:Mrp family chromosome partitioning ATPase
MSRIADVLQKARKEREVSPDGREHPNELVLRTMADVPDSWQLQGRPPGVQAPATPPVTPVELRIAPPPTPIASRRPENVATPQQDDETVALARRVFLGDDGQAARGRRALVATVGPTSRSGSIAIGVALTLARETGRPVSLVDLNVEGATLHDGLQLEGSPGVSDAVLQGMLVDACTQEIPSAPSLRFLASGSDPHALRASLADSRTRNRIRALLGIFDYVVAHAAPLSTADTVALGSLFDGVVLVLEAGKTSPDEVRTTAAALKEADLKVLGTVVDNRQQLAETPASARPT